MACRAWLGATVLVAAPTVAAAAPPLAIDLRLQMGGGGDKVATVAYSDGSESDLRLGTYAQLGVGVLATPFARDIHAVDVEVFLGWATWSTGPENTDDRIKLGRLPMELLTYYRISPPALPVAVRVGGGLAYHVIGGIAGSGSLDAYDTDVANARGWVAELGVLYDALTFNVRYTAMKYEVGPAKVGMDASSVAGSVGVVFPLRSQNASGGS